MFKKYIKNNVFRIGTKKYFKKYFNTRIQILVFEYFTRLIKTNKL